MTKHLSSLFLVTLVFAALCASASATLISNGDFETLPVEGTIPAGWTLDFNSYGTHAAGTPHSPSHVLHPGAGGPSGGSYQDLATAVGSTYQVSLWVQNFGDLPSPTDGSATPNVTVLVGSPGAGYTFADGGVSTAFGLAGVTATSIAPAANGSWSQTSFSFVAAGTTTRFGVYNDPLLGVWSTNVDDVSVVPEPATIILLGLGCAALPFARRRRR
jgi:hypothetical protein